MKTIIMHSSIENTLDFVRNAIRELDETGIHPRDIKILMPNFFKEIMFNYHRERMRYIGNPETEMFYAKEILPHYKNEIVVFNEKYFKTNNHFRILSLEI